MPERFSWWAEFRNRDILEATICYGKDCKNCCQTSPVRTSWGLMSFNLFVCEGNRADFRPSQSNTIIFWAKTRLNLNWIPNQLACLFTLETVCLARVCIRLDVFGCLQLVWQSCSESSWGHVCVIPSLSVAYVKLLKEAGKAVQCVLSSNVMHDNTPHMLKEGWVQNTPFTL